MKKEKLFNLRVLFVSTLMIVVMGLFTTNTFAKSTPSPVPGWGRINQEVLHAGPPGLSIRPIHTPGDIPLARQDIQLFLTRLRSYLDQLFNRNH